MKFKKAVLMCIFLLAILTIAPLSAEDAPNSVNGTDDLSQNQEKILLEGTDYNVYVPVKYVDSTCYGSDIVSVENMPLDAEGNISISVDNLERYNRKVVSGPNAIALGDLHLDYGIHSVEVRYTGDSKYGGFLKNASFERTYLGVEYPEEVYCESFHDYYLNVVLDEGVTGNINILIDNISVYNSQYDAKNPPSIDIREYLTNHTWEVRYSEGNRDDLIKRGSFFVSIFTEPKIYDGIVYGDSYTFYMEIPSEGRGVAKFKDKQYSFISRGYTGVPISDFDVGENVVQFTVEYEGFTQTRNCSLYVSPKVELPEIWIVNKTYNLKFTASEGFNDTLILSGMINATFNGTGNTYEVPVSFKNAGNYILNVCWGNYTWKYDVNVLNEAPKVDIFIVYRDEIYPDNADYDCDPDHAQFLYFISVTAYPYNLTGKTDVYLDNKKVAILSGEVERYNIWPDYYDFGTHTIRVEYLGDDTFEPKNLTYTYTVAPSRCVVEDDGTLRVNFPDGVSGKLKVKANGKTYTKKIKANSKRYCSFKFKNLKPDVDYTIKITFKAKPAKYSFTKTLNFRLPGPVSLEEFYWDYGEKDAIIFSMRDDCKNNPRVFIDGNPCNYTRCNEYDYRCSEGEIAYGVDVRNLKPGNHEIIITCSGDKKYSSTSINETIISFTHIDHDYEEKVVSLCLPDDAKGNLTLEIKYMGESDYTLFKAVPIKNGSAQIKLPPGEYYAKVYYSGDDYLVEEIKLEEFVDALSYSSDSIGYGQSTKYTLIYDLNATLVFCLGNDAGARLPVAWFDLSYNDVITVNQTLIDDILTHNMAKAVMNHNYATEGFWDLKIYPIVCTDIGTFETFYSLDVYFSGNVAGAENINMQYCTSRYLNLKVYDYNGEPVGENHVVTIEIDGDDYYDDFEAKTNKDGEIRFMIPKNMPPGNYAMTIKHSNSWVTKQLTITHILSFKAVKVKKSAKKIVLTAKLKKVNGKYLKGVNVKFKFNGMVFNAKTNNKGVAKVTVKSKYLKKLKVGKKVNYQATYLKDTVKRTAKVKK